MTVEELSRIVRQASNTLWVRYWLHWNYPKYPSEIALSAIDMNGEGKEWYEHDLPEGFRKETHENKVYYIWPRTNEDGSLYYGA